MTNEINHPYVVEVAFVSAGHSEGLDVELSRRIMELRISRDTFSRDMDEQLLLSEAKSFIVGAFPIY